MPKNRRRRQQPQNRPPPARAELAAADSLVRVGSAHVDGSGTREIQGEEARSVSSAERQEDVDKRVEFYSAVANGWISTRMTYDTTMVTLSAGGIGLLVTLLAAVGVRSLWEGGLYAIGTLGFGGAIGVALAIFRRNSAFLEDLARGRGENGDPSLRRLDRSLLVFFAAGLLGGVAVGGSAGYDKYQEQRKAMMPESAQKPARSDPASAPQSPTQAETRRSLDGLERLRRPEGSVSSVPEQSKRTPDKQSGQPTKPNKP